MRSRRSSRWANRPEISLNAFADLVLNILLFFLFATELAVTESLDIRLPESDQTKASTNEKQPLTVFITKENEYVVDGEKVPLNQLPERLRAKQTKATEEIVIKADRDTTYQSFYGALGVVQNAGFKNIRLPGDRPSPQSSPAKR